MLTVFIFLTLGSSPREIFSAQANPAPGSRQQFDVKNLVGGKRYLLVTSGACEAPRGRHRRRVHTVGADHRAPFGTEYRITLGRLEFSTDTDARSQPFRADEGIHSLEVENRSSDLSSGVTCKLTSIVIREE